MNKQQTISSILMEMSSSVKDKIDRGANQEEAAKVITEETLTRVRAFAKTHGVDLDQDVIDIEVTPSKPQTESPEAEFNASSSPGGVDSPKGWFAKLRWQLNSTVMELFKVLRLDKVGEILTTDVKTLFNLSDRDTAAAAAGRKVGYCVGTAAGLKLGVPMVGPVVGKAGELLTAVSCKIVGNPNAIMATEFARGSLEELMRFGVRHEELNHIAQQYFERINELDRAIGASIQHNETLKKQVLDNISSAHDRVSSQIRETSKKLSQGMDDFDADIQSMIQKL